MSELYFAYGSNMSSRRLLARIPAARAVGPGRLGGRQLVFNKPSRDGSGKANLIESPGAVSWGVLWRIAAPDWRALDRYEPGYRRITEPVFVAAGRIVLAQLYVHAARGPDIPPFDWYVAHLLAGAREHRLPACYVQSLRARLDPRGSQSGWP